MQHVAQASTDHVRQAHDQDAVVISDATQQSCNGDQERCNKQDQMNQEQWNGHPITDQHVRIAEQDLAQPIDQRIVSGVTDSVVENTFDSIEMTVEVPASKEAGQDRYDVYKDRMHSMPLRLLFFCQLSLWLENVKQIEPHCLDESSLYQDAVVLDLQLYRVRNEFLEKQLFHLARQHYPRPEPWLLHDLFAMLQLIS